MPSGGGTSIGNALTDALFGTRQVGEGVGKWLLGVQSRNEQGTQARCAGVRGAASYRGPPARTGARAARPPQLHPPVRRRAYTEGAQVQLPRKIPLRIEPKTYFGEPCAHSRRCLAAPACRRACLGMVFHPYPHPPQIHTNTHHCCPPAPPAANERTFLAWLSMATTLGTVGTAIAGLAEDGTGKHQGPISQVGAEGERATACWGRSA